MKNILILFIIFSFSGCAESILNSEERTVLASDDVSLQPTMTARNLAEAAVFANRLSAAYFRAGQRSMRSQDAATAALVVTAGSVVAGAATGVSDKALANASIGAVGLQQAASRGVPKTSVVAIYNGAQSLNCIGAVASVYQLDPVIGNSPIAAEITMAIIREIRIGVRTGLARELPTFASLISAFKAVLEGGDGTMRVESLQVSPVDFQNRLEEYLTRLSGCVEKPAASDNAQPADPAE